jgi:hypothetical protein
MESLANFLPQDFVTMRILDRRRRNVRPALWTVNGAPVRAHRRTPWRFRLDHTYLPHRRNNNRDFYEILATNPNYEWCHTQTGMHLQEVQNS